MLNPLMKKSAEPEKVSSSKTQEELVVFFQAFPVYECFLFETIEQASWVVKTDPI